MPREYPDAQNSYIHDFPWAAGMGQPCTGTVTHPTARGSHQSPRVGCCWQLSREEQLPGGKGARKGISAQIYKTLGPNYYNALIRGTQ